MAGFAHDIAGGNGNLIAASLQSPNFSLSGETGWAIMKNGDAYFFNITADGDITATEFIGTDFEINSAGVFFYSGTPTLGNLLLSITNSSGSNDGHGNAYQAGVTVYNGSANVQVHVNPTVDAPAIEMPTGAAIEADHPAIYAFIPNPSSAAEVEQLNIAGPALTTDSRQPQIILSSSAKDASSVANILLSNGKFSGYPPLVLTDTSVNTNANNGMAPVTVGWSIPANDPMVGTVYELWFPYSGTFENQTIGFKPGLNNAAVATSGGDIVGSGFLTSGAGFAGQIRLKVQVTAVGASGIAKMFLDGGLGANTTRSAGSNNNDAYLSSQNTSVAFNTTVANTIGVYAEWGGSTSGQTISGFGSTFTRIGQLWLLLIASLVPSSLALLGMLLYGMRWVSKMDRNTEATEELTRAFNTFSDRISFKVDDHEVRLRVLESRNAP